jgi:hypothetical protein
MSAAQELSLSGSFQIAGVSGILAGNRKTTERFNRSQVTAEQGNWAARATIWNYTFCTWHDLDETTLSFQTPKLTARVGRFLAPIGQTNWDDQWYSNFVFLPFIETQTYGDSRLLARTSSGADVDYRMGRETIRVAFLNASPQWNRLLPDKLDRALVRVQSSQANAIYGFTAFSDTKNGGGDEQMLVADVRYTIPHWIVRAETLAYQSATQKFSGYFIDFNHRPKNWEDVTLAFRLQRIATMRGVRNDINGWTAAVKTQLPWDVSLSVNYMGGPDMNRLTLGGGWGIGINKTFQF